MLLWYVISCHIISKSIWSLWSATSISTTSMYFEFWNSTMWRTPIHKMQWFSIPTLTEACNSWFALIHSTIFSKELSLPCSNYIYLYCRCFLLSWCSDLMSILNGTCPLATTFVILKLCALTWYPSFLRSITPFMAARAAAASVTQPATPRSVPRLLKITENSESCNCTWSCVRK